MAREDLENPEEPEEPDETESLEELEEIPTEGKRTTHPIVVGIGASAGGLNALRTFFSNVPKDTGLAFVVVVHLSPDHESHLASILQPHVRMPVQQVSETVRLESNR